MEVIRIGDRRRETFTKDMGMIGGDGPEKGGVCLGRKGGVSLG